MAQIFGSGYGKVGLLQNRPTVINVTVLKLCYRPGNDEIRRLEE